MPVAVKMYLLSNRAFSRFENFAANMQREKMMIGNKDSTNLQIYPLIEK